MFPVVLAGWRIAPGLCDRGRKVRTPQGRTPRNRGLDFRIHTGEKLEGFLTDSATENQTARERKPAGKGEKVR